MEGGGATGVDLSRKFVSETELDEKRKKRQEEWEKVRKPDDPEEAPEEAYDSRSLFERLQEQKDKKQEEFEEQLKFRNMVRGLDEDESSFLDEVSRQQCLTDRSQTQTGLSADEESGVVVETVSQGRVPPTLFPSLHCGLFVLTLHRHSALVKQASVETRREPEKKAAPKHSGPEQRTSHLSQAHLLAGAVKRRSSSQSSDSSKKQKVEITTAEKVPSAPPGSGQGVLHLPSAAVCVGVLPGLWVYSGSSDSESSSDSEGSVDAFMVPYPRLSKAYR
ncbi:NEFA-interacting nuclear protein NIP30 [Scophthalmus maximus]|uniref:NEFA-interacting nuclear protein NIP30 n=1 Tax=Scophthalmus maximus TaxID=52904 RepID=A0A2U9BXC2_SCOMX|nr:NEFA-interacting nuclear protein NIP30 [Scophthalmus maximus]